MCNLKKILLTIMMAFVFCTLFTRAMDLHAIKDEEGTYNIVFYYFINR